MFVRLLALIVLFVVSPRLIAQQPVFRYGNGVAWEYAYHSKSTKNAGVRGISGKIVETLDIGLTSTVDSATGGKLHISSSITRVDGTEVTPQRTRKSGDEYVGKRFAFTWDAVDGLLPVGNYRDGKESGKTLMLQFPHLDANKMRVGNSWTSTKSDTMKSLGMNLAGTAVNHYTVLDSVVVNSRPCYRIHVDGTAEGRGAGKFQDKTLDLVVSAKSSGEILYDIQRGMVLNATLSIDIDIKDSGPAGCIGSGNETRERKLVE